MEVCVEVVGVVLDNFGDGAGMVEMEADAGSRAMTSPLPYQGYSTCQHQEATACPGNNSRDRQ